MCDLSAGKWVMMTRWRPVALFLLLCYLGRTAESRSLEQKWNAVKKSHHQQNLYGDRRFDDYSGWDSDTEDNEDDYDSDQQYRDFLGEQALKRRSFDPMMGFGPERNFGRDKAAHHRDHRQDRTPFGQIFDQRNSLLNDDIEYREQQMEEKYKNLARKMDTLQEKMDEMEQVLAFQYFTQKRDKN